MNLSLFTAVIFVENERLTEGENSSSDHRKNALPPFCLLCLQDRRSGNPWCQTSLIGKLFFLLLFTLVLNTAKKIGQGQSNCNGHSVP